MNSDFSTHAGNFGDALQTQVDPRTGQFMVNFPVAQLIGNHQLGPEMPLSLRYSPLNSGNYGFGNGFTIGTTYFNDRTHLLQLIDGEQYRVKPGTDKVRDKKLNNFRFCYTNGNDDNDGYTVYWKDGKIEQLVKTADRETFATASITSPLGRRLTLTWDWSGQVSRISKIEDESSTLCEIIYGTQTQLKVWPNTPDFYQLNFQFINDQLNSITRRVSDSVTFHWNFIYDNVGHSQNQLTLTGVEYPTGMKDKVQYNKDDGLQFPNNSNQNSKLPCVLTHRRQFGNNQSDMVIQYEYTRQNFLGYNGDFGDWSADSDYIYTTLTDYTYGSTETARSDDLIIKTRRTYNNYHLQISEEVNRQGNIYRTEMTYYAEKHRFINDQPPQFKLLKEKHEIFRDENGKERLKKTLTEFDESGNPTCQIDPDDTKTLFTWYQANGENECPAEPNGFVRFMKEKHVIPPKITGLEPNHSTKYTYATLNNTNYVVQDTVMTFSNEAPLTKRRFEYESENKASELGRITKITDTLYDLKEKSKSYDTVKRFNTTVSGNQMTQITTTSLIDGLETTSSRTQSYLSGTLHHETSSIGIETRYFYDALGRLERRTISPDSEYECTTTWEYAIDENGPYTIEIDPYGNKKKTLFDGAARVTAHDIFHAETDKWYEASSTSRNSLGEIVSGTVKDWLPNTPNSNFPLTSNITYDGWGGKKEVNYSDGRINHQLMDPITLTETTYVQGTIGTSLLTTSSLVTTHDPKSELPLTKVTKDTLGKEYSRCRLNWNGLRQLLEEYDELDTVTTRTYDEYGRVVTQTSPDGTVLTRTYAPHLIGSKIASVSVEGLDANGTKRTWLLGTQTFDSSGRLKESVSGGRVTSYTYDGIALKPSTVTLPSGKTVSYTYIPQLNYAISSITCDDVTQNFTYDKKTGKMLTAREADSEITNTWSPMGELKEETFSHAGQNRQAKYTYTLNGAPLTYTDVTGKQMTYSLDSHGRANRITDDTMLVDLTYDALGRPHSHTVYDTSSGSSFTKTLEYDNFSREITRTITNNDMTLVLSQTWQKNNLLATRMTTKNGIKLREEQYDYDNRKRLLSYNVTGESLPIDAYNQKMLAQTYRYDALNNITSVVTTLSDRSTDIAKFFYLNANDPTQLSKVTHSHKKYPNTINLSYDIEGRMTCDEAGRTLAYDTLGRLISVSENNTHKGTYSYDALNRLITRNAGDGDIRELYYRGSELVNEVIVTKNRETRLIKTGHTCFGVSDDSGLTLTAGDQNDSLLWSTDSNDTDKDGQLHVWSPYGSGTPDNRLPGFNGERIDPVSGTYHLGNGYRAYNPVLMRFNCPDSLSPFEAGGINPYAYCAGDPVNHVDPSGHLSWQSILGIVTGVIGVTLAVFTAGASIAAAGGVMAAIGSTSVTSLIVGGLGIVSDVTGIVSGSLEDSNPNASGILGWVSLATGLVGLAAGAKGLFKRAVKSRGNTSGIGGYKEYELQVEDAMSREADVPGGGKRRGAPQWYEIEHEGKRIYGADQQVNAYHVSQTVHELKRAMDANEIPRKPIEVISGTHGTPGGFSWDLFGRRSEHLIHHEFYEEDLELKLLGGVNVRRTRVLTRFDYVEMLNSPDCHVVLAFCYGRNERTLLELLNLPVVKTFSSTFYDDIINGYIIRNKTNEYWVWAPHALSQA